MTGEVEAYIDISVLRDCRLVDRLRTAYQVRVRADILAPNEAILDSLLGVLIPDDGLKGLVTEFDIEERAGNKEKELESYIKSQLVELEKRSTKKINEFMRAAFSFGIIIIIAFLLNNWFFS